MDERGRPAGDEHLESDIGNEDNGWNARRSRRLCEIDGRLGERRDERTVENLDCRHSSVDKMIVIYFVFLDKSFLLSFTVLLSYSYSYKNKNIFRGKIPNMSIILFIFSNLPFTKVND